MMRLLILLGVLLAWPLAAAVPVSAQEVGAANTSVYVGGGRWDWTIYITAPAETLRRIQCVQYRLHPTFTNPIRKVCALGDSRHPFGLSQNGWGTFTIPVTVFFTDGKTVELQHRLAFVEKPLNTKKSVKLANTAKEVQKGLWEWTAYVEGPRAELAQIKCVRYMLHPTFPNPNREVCKIGAGQQAFALTTRGWGTFQLKARIFFKDGTSLDLVHDLRLR